MQKLTIALVAVFMVAMAIIFIGAATTGYTCDTGSHRAQSQVATSMGIHNYVCTPDK